MYEKNKGNALVATVVGVFLLIAFLLFINPFTTIQPHQVGIVSTFGSIQGTVHEGPHIINPLSDVTKMNITSQQVVVDASAASRDLQSATTQVSVLYSIDPEKSIELYREFTNKHQDRLIEPSIQEAVKGATAKYSAEELITRRDEVKGLIYEDLKARLSSRNIRVSEVLITDFKFSESFNTSVEAKVKAEQDALAAKNKLEQTKYEAEQKVVTATADAEAIRIQAEAITSQGGAEYVNMKAVEKWNGVLPVQMIPGSTVPFINLN